MVKLQNSFKEFHDAIKLELDDKELLRQKRKEIEDALKTGVSEFTFNFFNQGSYSTYTGVKPIDEYDYDIDRGMVAEMSREEMKPKEAKKIVQEALILKFGEDNVKVKSPCVTVYFPQDNLHVDIALYCKENDNYFLARGKLGSSDENTAWEDADPKKLRDKINEVQTNSEDRDQYRRNVRYLKRWKDIKFKNQENRPTGIGISVIGLDKFAPECTVDTISNVKQYDDALALKKFVEKIINSFQKIYDEETGEFFDRLEVKLPVKPYTDVYCKVTNNQMEDFKKKLEDLKETLNDAIYMSDLHDATELLKKQFGDDFPVKEQAETARAFAKKATINDYPSA